MDNNTNFNTSNNNSGDNSIAIASMVLGIIGIITCWIPILGLVLAIIAVVLSTKGLKKAKTTNSGKGFSIAGLSCGTVGLIFSIIYIFVWTIAIIAVKESYDQVNDYNKSRNTYKNSSYSTNYRNYNKYNALDDYNF